MYIAIDTGNKNIKTVHNVFVSGVTESATEPVASPKTDWIRYNGQYYVLSANRGEYRKDKSVDNRYFILALFGIVKELESLEKEGRFTFEKGQVVNITLLTGLPPAHMEDKELKRHFQSYFRTGQPVTVLYNDRIWTVDIKSVRVYVQCFSALMSQPDLFVNKNRIFALDIGGFTSDYMEFVNGKINLDHTDSMENGVIPFYRMVQKDFRKKFDAVLDESAIDEMLGTFSDLYTQEMIDLARKDAEKYVTEFLSLFREMGIDLKNTFVIFMGGGSVLLWEFFKKSPLLKNCTLISDVKANAIGYDALANHA